MPSLNGPRRIVVMSFETARNDIALLDDLPWSCVIVDEVHRLKNPRSGTALAYDQFTCDVRFGLTGTGKHRLTCICTSEGTQETLSYPESLLGVLDDPQLDKPR